MSEAGALLLMRWSGVSGSQGSPRATTACTTTGTSDRNAHRPGDPQL